MVTLQNQLSELIKQFRAHQKRRDERIPFGVFGNSSVSIESPLIEIHRGVTSKSNKSKFVKPTVQFLSIASHYLSSGELDINDPFYSFIYQAQIFIATHFPLKDTSLENRNILQNSFPLQNIDLDDSIVTASGFIYRKDFLTSYFANSTAYDWNAKGEILYVKPQHLVWRGDRIEPIHFSQYEIAQMIKQGITVLKPEISLLSTIRSEGLHITIDHVHPEVDRAVSFNRIHRAALYGGALSVNYLTTPLIISALLASTFLLFPFSPLALTVLTAIPLLVFTLAIKDLNFSTSFTISMQAFLASFILLSAFTLLSPYVVAGLSSISIISAASSAAASTIIPTIAALIPVAILGISATVNLFINNAILSAFSLVHAVLRHGIIENALRLPGLLLGGLAGIIGNIFRPSLRSAPVANITDMGITLDDDIHPLFAEDPDQEHSLTPNMSGIHKGLNITAGHLSENTRNEPVYIESKEAKDPLPFPIQTVSLADEDEIEYNLPKAYLN